MIYCQNNPGELFYLKCSVNMGNVNTVLSTYLLLLQCYLSCPYLHLISRDLMQLKATTLSCLSQYTVLFFAVPTLSYIFKFKTVPLAMVIANCLFFRDVILKINIQCLCIMKYGMVVIKVPFSRKKIYVIDIIIWFAAFIALFYSSSQ